MKPLYLSGARPLTVALDGPALRITQPGSSTLRFPLRHVSRVVVSGSVSWTTDALLACADEGICICFLTSRGAPRARLTGRLSSRGLLHQRWTDFLDHPDWPDLYKQWGRSSRTRALRFCARRLGWSPWNEPVSLANVILDMASKTVDVDEMNAAKKLLYGLAHSRVLEELARYGLRDDSVAMSHLAPHFVTIVQWGVHPDLVQWLADRARCCNTPASPPRPQDTVRFFEQKHRAVGFHLADAVRHLCRFLIGVE